MFRPEAIRIPEICLPKTPQSWIRLSLASQSTGHWFELPLAPAKQMALSPASVNVQPEMFPRVLGPLQNTALPPTASNQQLRIEQFPVLSRKMVPPRWKPHLLPCSASYGSI